MKPYLAQIRSNLRLMARDRTVLFFNYFFPLVFFVIFSLTFGGAKNPAAIGQVVNMVLVLGVLGSGFFGAGMRAVQDRESNVLRRFKVAPVGPAPIIVASLVSGLVSFLPSVAITVALAHFWMKMSLPARLGDFFVFVSLGAVAFRAMGMVVAAVVNSPQESQIITQMIYLPMLFLSGATFPLQFFPHWLRIVSQFIPAAYLFQGMQSIFIAGESLASNWLPVLSLVITLLVALFIGIKLFRWEKEEKISGRAKLWIVAIMAPFFLMGVYQAKSENNLRQDKVLTRMMNRRQTRLFLNTRVFVGDGHVIPNGAVLVRNGKIARVFDSPPGDSKALNAEVVDASGKTLLPGLIDMHVHLGSPGGLYSDATEYLKPDAIRRELAAYLYSGVTAVRSVGDVLDQLLRAKEQVASGEYLGAELFTCGPMFTTEAGHGTEYSKLLPANIRQSFNDQTIRTPHSATEAAQQVHELKDKGADCIKAILETGMGSTLFERLDSEVYRSIAKTARGERLPLATHTGDSQDVHEAVAVGTTSIEHGSMRNNIEAPDFKQMTAKGIAYDPTLSVAEAGADVEKHDLKLLDRSLVQQVAPASLLTSTRMMLGFKTGDRHVETESQRALAVAAANLRSAFRAGVQLIAGSDAGNLLVIHGPTVQHELALWVAAGIPPVIALEAATRNAARVLGQDNRLGSIQEGKDANLILVEGDPVEDITSLERITFVLLRGERVDRSELFKQAQN